MKTVRQLLNDKGSQIWSVSPDTPILQALQLMAEKDIGALLVLEGDKIAGIFTERDYARKVILRGKTSKNTPVKEIMTSPVVTAEPKQTALQCLAVLSRQRIRYLPVVEGARLAGLISIGDVAQAIIADQESDIQRLEDIVMGKDPLG
jgi:CBS domain-containing protein